MRVYQRCRRVNVSVKDISRALLDRKKESIVTPRSTERQGETEESDRGKVQTETGIALYAARHGKFL